MNGRACITRREPGIGTVLVFSRKHEHLETLDPDALPNGSAVSAHASVDTPPGTLSAPFKLFIACTRKCDLDCPMCFSRGDHESPPEMTGQTVLRMISEAAAMGVLEVRLTGGEPTVHPSFFDFIQSAHREGMQTSVTTHGAYGPRLLQKMIEAPVDDVRISIDGPEAIHDALRGPGTFRRAVTSVRELKAAGKTVRINTMVYAAT
jgi:MoaA/NifB/PqqE/SkfB family radical SAM enzyme